MPTTARSSIGAVILPEGREAEFRGFKASYEISSIKEVAFVGPNSFIGGGATGTVHRARWKGMDCAVKRFDYSKSHEGGPEAFRTEAFFLRNLWHANLVRLYCVCSTPPDLCLVMELMVGSLDRLLWGPGARDPETGLFKNPMTPLRELRIAKGVAAGLAFLHERDVAHRDLKSSNVLYDRDLRVKLCDFAFAKFKDGLAAEATLDSRVGTPAYMAPEILCGEDYTARADIYSFGVVLWEVLHRARPFAELTNAFAIAYQVGTLGRRLPIRGGDASGALDGVDNRIGQDGTPTAETSDATATAAGPPLAPIWRWLLNWCWQPEAARPSAQAVFAQLSVLLRLVKKRGPEALANCAAPPALQSGASSSTVATTARTTAARGVKTGGEDSLPPLMTAAAAAATAAEDGQRGSGGTPGSAGLTVRNRIVGGMSAERSAGAAAALAVADGEDKVGGGVATVHDSARDQTAAAGVVLDLPATTADGGDDGDDAQRQGPELLHRQSNADESSCGGIAEEGRKSSSDDHDSSSRVSARGQRIVIGGDGSSLGSTSFSPVAFLASSSSSSSSASSSVLLSSGMHGGADDDDDVGGRGRGGHRPKANSAQALAEARALSQGLMAP